MSNSTGAKPATTQPTKSAATNETKTLIIILVVGIIIISGVGYIAWNLILSKFSTPPEDLVTESMKMDTKQQLPKDESGQSPFGFSDTQKSETTPESNPTEETAAPSESSSTSVEPPTEEEKAPTSTKRPPQTDAVAETKTEPKTETSTTTPPPVATPSTATKSATETKPEPAKTTTPAVTPPTTSTTAPAAEPKKEVPPVTQPTATPSVTAPAAEPANYPAIGKMPYSILVHSFEDSQGESGLVRANRSTQKLKDMGYGAFWTKGHAKGKNWYRVMVGIFSTDKEARNYAANIANKVGTELTVLKLPYAVELGWQKSVEDANAVDLKLARFQYSTYRWIVEKDGIRWVLLRTGAFSTKDEAENLLKYLNSDGFRGRVVSR